MAKENVSPGVLFGYARVSTSDQNLDMQINALKKYGVKEENIFFEKVSGTKKAYKKRVKWHECISKLRAGDELVFYKVDRISRHFPIYVEIFENLTEKKIKLTSLKEPIFSNSDTAAGKFLVLLMGAVAEFERDNISERTKAGLQAKREKGETFGRPKGLSKLAWTKARLVYKLRKDKSNSVKDICDTVKISKQTMYNYEEYYKEYLDEQVRLKE